MPELCRFYGIIIRMYFEDHNPPHFHADYQGSEAMFDILTLEILEGSLPNRARALVLEWASAHRNELLDNWSKAIQPASLTRIEPLV